MFYLKALIVSRIMLMTAAQIPPVNVPNASAEFLAQILQQIYEEQSFQTLVLVRPRAEKCLVDNVHSLLPAVPKLVLTEQAHVDLLARFNHEVLVLVCLPTAYGEQLLDVLASSLNNMRDTRCIFLIGDSQRQFATLQTLLEYWRRKRLTNAIALMADFQRTGRFTRCQPFPHYHLVNESFASRRSYFPTHWRDMQGTTIMSLSEQLEPRAFTFRDSGGRERLSGYVGKLMAEFAWQHNATLKQLLPRLGDKVNHFSFLRVLTDNGTLDLPAATCPISTLKELHLVSYPLELMSWFLVAPAADELATSDVYTILMSRNLTLLLLALLVVFSLIHTMVESLLSRSRQDFWTRLLHGLLNDKVLPGMLGQSFAISKSPTVSLRTLYLLIFLLGLMVSTLFAAHLKALLTKHPTMPEINTLADVRARHMKIYINETELVKQYVEPAFFKELEELIVSADPSSLQRLRMAYNTSYVYSIVSAVWWILERQQKYFSRKIFRAPKGLTIVPVMIIGLPLQANSIYRKPLDRFIHQVHDSGLLIHWKTLTMNDLVASKKLSLKDPNKRRAFHEFKVNDLKWVWLLLLLGLGIAGMVFAIELLIGSRLCNKN